MVTENKELLYAFIIGTSVFLVLVLLVLIMVYLHMQKLKRFKAEKEFTKAQHYQELLKTQLEIQEQTLTHISQEVHDNIGQTLSVVKVYLGTVSSTDNDVQAKVKASFQLLTKAIQDLRGLSHNLNTDFIHEKGLVKSIQDELDVIRNSGTVKVDFEAGDISTPLSKETELVLFRVVQELLANILKHANANQVNVKISAAAHLNIVVADNGVGFNVDDNSLGSGLGLKNIKKRVALIGGKIGFYSKIGEGTTVTIQLQLNS